MDAMESSLPEGATPRAPWSRALLGRLLAPWVRIKRDPAEPLSLLDANADVVYVIERGGLSDGLILERACREAGMPDPLKPMPGGGRRRRSMFALSRRDGSLYGRNHHSLSRETLRTLLLAQEVDPQFEIQLMPVSIYVGRAPNRQSGLLNALLSENWVMVGRFRRLLALLFNGRETIVHFSRPISLREALGESAGQRPERLQRKIARVLRVHFRRVRTAVIGPDLSHRRTVVDSVLNAESVRAVSFLLSGFWNKLYDGIDTHHFETLRAIAPGHEIIYVPCHRSHADYVLMSYQLYQSGVVVPHISAGVNLNLPVLGTLLRRGGAFFQRRSFKGNALYSVVFKEYMAQLIDRGVPLEYFIEGTRSRTGRLLEPRAGLLSMTVRAYLRAPRRPVLFQPVYIGYEKLMEGRAYIGELTGKEKEKESWWSLLRGARNALRQHYGRVALNFGEQVPLAPLLDAAAPGWREEA